MPPHIDPAVYDVRSHDHSLHGKKREKIKRDKERQKDRETEGE